MGNVLQIGYSCSNMLHLMTSKIIINIAAFQSQCNHTGVLASHVALLCLQKETGTS